MLTAAPKAQRAINTSLCALSIPSMSKVGSASAYPSCCASSSASAKVIHSCSIRVKIKLQVPVHHPANLINRITRQSLPQNLDNRHTTRHRRLMRQRQIPIPRLREQIIIAMAGPLRQQSLIRRHHRLPRRQSGGNALGGDRLPPRPAQQPHPSHRTARKPANPSSTKVDKSPGYARNHSDLASPPRPPAKAGHTAAPTNPSDDATTQARRRRPCRRRQWQCPKADDLSFSQDGIKSAIITTRPTAR